MGRGEGRPWLSLMDRELRMGFAQEKLGRCHQNRENGCWKGINSIHLPYVSSLKWQLYLDSTKKRRMNNSGTPYCVPFIYLFHINF